MLAVVTSLIAGISGSGSTAGNVGLDRSGAAGATAPSADSRAQGVVRPRAAPVFLVTPSAAFVVYGERCRSARNAVSHYRALTWSRQEARAGELADRTPIVRSKTCRWARFAAETWQARARSARQSLERWVETRTLRDLASWPRAVREVQRVFPGTEGWLLSCSAAESNHTTWVGYGGVPYSTWLRDSNTVGGYLQFRFQTFKGMFRRGVEYARERGFRVPTKLRDHTAAWRSALGQAIAGGWARWSGNDDSHWSASWGRGC